MLLLSTGCISFYELPDSASELSTLVFEKGYDLGDRLGASTMQSYWVVENRKCSKKSRIAFFGWTVGDSLNRDVEANKPLSILAETERHIGTAVASGAFVYGETHKNVCRNNITFTPKPGHTYRVRQNTKVGVSCNIEVIDDTSSEILDLTSVDDPDFCAEATAG